MAKGDNSRKNKPKRGAKKVETNKSGTFGRTPVLNVDGFKTAGLSRKDEGIKVKGVDGYQVLATENVDPALAQEKERTKAIKKLLDSLHPGYQVPEETSFRGLVLSGRDLERVRFVDNILKNTKMRECQLRSAVFKSCDLTGADLRRADLTGAIFDHCNLNGADLRGCDLSNARIVDCDLFAVNLDNSKLEQAVIDHCSMGAQSFHNSSCKGIKLFNSQVIHGFFDSADMVGAEIRNMLFRDCTLTNTHFDRAILDECCFRACDSIQEGPVFSGCEMSNITMMDCEFEDTQLVSTHISHSRMERVNMASALLEGALFDDVVFDEGSIRDCYSLEEAPTFNQCTLEHLLIEGSELCNAHFNKSSFIGARIIDSDFEAWEMNHTGMDGNTIIESCYGAS